MNKTLLVVCAIAVLLGACKRGGDVAQENMAPADTAPVSQAEAAPQYTKGVSKHGFLVVVPGEIASCGDSVAAATVSWSVDKPAADGLRVEVGGQDGAARILFSQGDNKGEAVTESWVRVGTAFYLVDMATGEDIDTFVVGSKACRS